MKENKFDNFILRMKESNLIFENGEDSIIDLTPFLKQITGGDGDGPPCGHCPSYRIVQCPQLI
jgi:hypothetical protein